MTGKDHYTIAGISVALAEIFAALGLLFAARTPFEVLLCGIAVVIAFIALALYMED